MELSNSFLVDVPVETAWEILSDVPTIAPCLPGAQLQEIEGEEYRGIVKVKVGPIVAQYKGKATFVERDEDARRMVLKAEGRETRGQGNASAMITAQLRAQGDRTEVVVDTDLTVTGKVAQFGRGVMADVSGKLMGQFADNLASTVLAGGTAAEAAPAEDAGPETAPAEAAPPETAPAEAAGKEPAEPVSNVRRLDLPEPEPVDLLDAAGAPTLKRLVPAVIAGVVLVLVIRLLVRRRRG